MKKLILCVGLFYSNKIFCMFRLGDHSNCKAMPVTNSLVFASRIDRPLLATSQGASTQSVQPTMQEFCNFNEELENLAKQYEQKLIFFNQNFDLSKLSQKLGHLISIKQFNASDKDIERLINETEEKIKKIKQEIETSDFNMLDQDFFLSRKESDLLRRLQSADNTHENSILTFQEFDKLTSQEFDKSTLQSHVDDTSLQGFIMLNKGSDKSQSCVDEVCDEPKSQSCVDEVCDEPKSQSCVDEVCDELKSQSFIDEIFNNSELQSFVRELFNNSELQSLVRELFYEPKLQSDVDEISSELQSDNESLSGANCATTEVENLFLEMEAYIKRLYAEYVEEESLKNIERINRKIFNLRKSLTLAKCQEKDEQRLELKYANEKHKIFYYPIKILRTQIKILNSIWIIINISGNNDRKMELKKQIDKYIAQNITSKTLRKKFEQSIVEMAEINMIKTLDELIKGREEKLNEELNKCKELKQE